MKNFIKLNCQIVFVIVLFCSAALADGDMSNGGKNCTGSVCPGFAATGSDQTTDASAGTTDIAPNSDDENPMLTFVNGFLAEIGIN